MNRFISKLASKHEILTLGRARQSLDSCMLRALPGEGQNGGSSWFRAFNLCQQNDDTVVAIMLILWLMAIESSHDHECGVTKMLMLENRVVIFKTILMVTKGPNDCY